MPKAMESERYLTRNIANEIEPLIQMYLWELIDERKHKGEEVDYFQIFDLSVENQDGKAMQKIVHRQEEPEYSCVHYLNYISEPITCKIWVIDSGEYWTMLFPEEY